MDFTRGYDWDGDEKPAAMVFLKSTLRIRLTDPGKNPLPHAKCRVVSDPETIYECDDDGVVEMPVRDGTQSSLDLEWGPGETTGEAGDFCWQGTFRLDVASADDEACRARLAHLGFDGSTLQTQVSAYQSHFGTEATGDISDIREQLIDWHDGGDRPAREEEME